MVPRLEIWVVQLEGLELPVSKTISVCGLTFRMRGMAFVVDDGSLPTTT